MGRRLPSSVRSRSPKPPPNRRLPGEGLAVARCSPFPVPWTRTRARRLQSLMTPPVARPRRRSCILRLLAIARCCRVVTSLLPGWKICLVCKCFCASHVGNSTPSAAWVASRSVARPTAPGRRLLLPRSRPPAHLRGRLPRAHRARSRRGRGPERRRRLRAAHGAAPRQRTPGLLRSRLQAQRRRERGRRAADHPARTDPAPRTFNAPIARYKAYSAGQLKAMLGYLAALQTRAAREPAAGGARGVARRLCSLAAARRRLRSLRGAQRCDRRHPRRAARWSARPALHRAAPAGTRAVAGRSRASSCSASPCTSAATCGC